MAGRTLLLFILAALAVGGPSAEGASTSDRYASHGDPTSAASASASASEGTAGIGAGAETGDDDDEATVEDVDEDEEGSFGPPPSRRPYARRDLFGSPPNRVKASAGAWRFGTDDLEDHSPYSGGHSRQRRSADYLADYWHNTGDPDPLLMKMSPGYAMKNYFSERMENHMRPLHYGRIYEGNIGNPASYAPGERVFGVDADFNFPQDMNQFKYKPSGPRLNLQEWAAQNFPIYSHSVYRLTADVGAIDNVKGVRLTPPIEFNVDIPRGVYRMKVITNDASVVMKNLRTGATYKFPPNFLKKPDEIVKLQAVAPWVDPNGRYWRGEDGAYFIRGTPLMYNNPKFGNPLVSMGLPSDPPTVAGTLIPPENALPTPVGINLP